MNKSEHIKEIILEKNPKAKFLEKIFDSAILGYGVPCGEKYVAVYDSNKCIKILMKSKEVNENETEAYEQYAYLIDSSYPSENNPIIFGNFKNIKIIDLPDTSMNTNLKNII